MKHFFCYSKSVCGASAYALTLTLVVCLFTPSATAQDKPDLSDEILKVMNKDGIDAAKEFFARVYPDKKDNYTIDITAFTMLTSELVQDGKMDEGMALAEMFATVAQDAYMQNPQLAALAKMAEADEAERRTDKRIADKETMTGSNSESVSDAESVSAAAPSSSLPDVGPSRTDLARFMGMYGDPNESDVNRRLFVTQTCDGRLASGPVWADTSPWILKSIGDQLFSHSSSFDSFEMSFTSETMTHEFDYLPSPLQKLGPLLDGWDACLQTGR